MTLEQFLSRNDFVLLPKLLRWFQALAGFRVTPLGWLVLLAWGVTATMSASGLERPVYLIACAWTAPVVIALILGRLLLPRVAVTADFPDRAAAGQSIAIRCTLQNKRRWPALSLGTGIFQLPPEFDTAAAAADIDAIGPGETAHSTVQIVPRRRGIYSMPPVKAFSTFPLNLYRTPAGQSTTWPLLVLPSFHPLYQIDVPLGLRYQPGGISLTSNTGESPEYIGNRDYFDGDSIRHIDFRAWARLAKPAVREFKEEYYCRVALVLDTFTGKAHPPSPDGFPDFEAAVSMTAAIADALSRTDYLIDLFAAGPELHVFRAGRHTAHFENILEILAGVGHTVDNPFERLAPALLEELRNISSVICVFLDWDESREHLVRAAAEAGSSTKVIIVRDGETSAPLNALHAWAGQVRQVSLAAVTGGRLGEL